uniref:Uncharacterized protein n=1 Tax=Pavo cristatus TaxID=9049 RepID=A0A8C9LEN0_PAVCR
HQHGHRHRVGHRHRYLDQQWHRPSVLGSAAASRIGINGGIGTRVSSAIGTTIATGTTIPIPIHTDVGTTAGPRAAQAGAGGLPAHSPREQHPGQWGDAARPGWRAPGKDAGGLGGVRGFQSIPFSHDTANEGRVSYAELCAGDGGAAWGRLNPRARFALWLGLHHSMGTLMGRRPYLIRVSMTEVEPVLDFASSGRTGRRNALPDILGSPAGVSPSDLPLKLAEMSLSAGSSQEMQSPSAEVPPPQPQSPELKDTS